MSKYLIAVLLLGHGLIVGAQSLGNFGVGSSQLTNPTWLDWWPTTLGRSWFLTNLNLEETIFNKAFGLFWLASGVCLMAAAFGMLDFVVPFAQWQSLAIYGAAGSFIMLILYLHPFFIIGILLDLAILAALLLVK